MITELRLQKLSDLSIDVSEVPKHRQPLFITCLKDGKKSIGRENAKTQPAYCLESALNKRMISREHATFEKVGNQYKLYDHSLNGTYVNYCRIFNETVLKPGQIVTFGHLNGANIRKGEKVDIYDTDLKYIVESFVPAEPEHHQQGQSQQQQQQQHSKPKSKRPTTVGTTKRKSSDPPTSSVGGKTKRLAETTMTTSNNNSGSSIPTGGTATTMVTDMYHYENELCSALPCRKPEGANIDWIQCDKCNNWYHQICVGISEDDLDDEDSYLCPYCKK